MPYLGKQSEQVGVSIQKYEFLQATDTSSGTTSFSVPSDAGDHVNVWLNGVLLVEGASNDYTTTNTTVVFGTAPADGDIVRIDVVESFSLPDALKSSGDTMTGPLKLDGGLKQQTSQDLSGTYAYHQMMVSDAFTVAGDVTISDNLVLTKISDDSNAITLTDDGSTRTITGTGSLETSTIAQTPNSSLTGMTGTLGSGITGSPNLNLGNATFPVGHIVGFGKAAGSGDPSGGVSATSYERFDNAIITYTPKAVGNLILLTSSVSGWLNNRSKVLYYTWYAGSSNIADTSVSSGGMGLSINYLTQVHEYGGTANDDFPISGDVRGWWAVQNTNSTEFSVYWKANDDASHVVIVNTLMEIQQ